MLCKRLGTPVPRQVKAMETGWLSPPISTRDPSGFQDIWQHLQSGERECCRDEVCALAAKEGHIELLQWLTGYIYV